MYSYFRYNDRQKIWVILNKEATLNFDGYSDVLPENTELIDVMDDSNWKDAVTIPAKGFRILEMRN